MFTVLMSHPYLFATVITVNVISFAISALVCAEVEDNFNS